MARRTVTRADLSEAIFQEIGLSRDESGKLVASVFDEIADKLITSQYVNQDIVKDNQKTIRNGIIQTARDTSETLVLYQKDIKANEEDLVQIINATNQNTAETSGLTLNQIVENIYLSNPQNLNPMYKF